MSGKLEFDKLFDPLYTRASDDTPVFNILANGVWREAETGKTFEVRTPIDGSLIARAQASSANDVKNMVDAAYRNRGEIRDIPGIDRLEIFRRAAEIMSEHRKTIIRTLMFEAGKPEVEAEGEVAATIDRMQITMEDARSIFGEYLPGDWSEATTQKIALVIHEPVGVVAAIASFNYPLFIAAAKIIPALLAGNTVVAKGASTDPLSLLLFGRILEAAGLPGGVLNIITGSGSDVGEALVSDDRVSAVTFTGSTEVGRFVARHAGIKKLHLELGGKGMAIVLDDADLDLAAARCVAGALKNAGQRCDAVSAVLVEEKVAEEFVKKVDKYMSEWKHGDPRDSSVKVGPVIDREAAERIHSLVRDAVEKGAELLRGGRFTGCYYEPTLLDKVPLTSRIAWEETFGPIVTVMRISNEDEALEISGKSRYGLDSCVFTNNFYRMWKIAKKLTVGGVTVNDLPRHGVGFFPFGGSKESGLGREGVGYSIDEMTQLKTIVLNLEPAGLGKARYRHEL